MTDGYVEKNFFPSESDLEKIRKFTRRDFAPDELYIFSLVLCNNDIDRDNEKFSLDALNELSLLFVGKTGIRDHSMKTADQLARVFETSVEKENGRKTADGEDYYCLKAKAYMIKNDENKNLIEEIDAGIKKEVSVSCSMQKSVCSICGKDRRSSSCNHINGRVYDGKKCFSILSGASDAYEWSFVAVPAQREAGVTKGFEKGKGIKDMNEIRKSLIGCENKIVLEKEDAEKLSSYIESVEAEAELGKEYKKNLVFDLTKLCKKSFPELDAKTFEGVANVMTTKELIAFKNAFISHEAKKNMPLPQLAKAEKKQNETYKEFKI